MNVPLTRRNMDWSEIDATTLTTVNDNYKAFYETLGSIELDSFLYIIDASELSSFVRNTLSAYQMLEEYLDYDLDLVTEWLPIGYTIDGVYILCNDSSVMLTDGGFESVEIYDMCVLDFIVGLCDNTVESNNLVADMLVIEHILIILSK